MKKSIYVFLMTSLILSFLLLGSFAYGATAKAPDSNEPLYGGTISFPRDINPVSWDIYDWTWSHGHFTGYYMEHLMMGDLQKGPRGTNETNFHDAGWIPPEVIRGELLENWEVKKNPLQIILHLRKGIMWQEKPGVMKARELVADDVVYSITRRKNSPKAVIKSYDFIGKMETPDKYTVVINMTEWCAEWPFRIGYGYFDAIQAPEQEKAPGGANNWKNATGTGPFMLTEYKDAHSLTYTKNSDYWDSEIIGRKKYKLPFVDKIFILIIKDEQTRLASFRSGKLDIILGMDWKHVDEIKKSLPQLKWQRMLLYSNSSVVLRMDKKPFNDIRVRRAMNLAVNKKEIIDSFFGGNALMHCYPFPPAFKEVYTPLDKLPPSVRELYTYNPEKAKKLLAEAGYPNGFTFKTQIPNNSQVALDLAQMLVSYLEKIGVKMELEPLDYSLFLSRMLKKNHSEGFFFRTTYDNPITGIRKNFTTGQTWNPHMMSDPYLDKTWTEATENPKLTEKQLMTVMKKLGVYVLEQVPCILIPNFYEYIAWWPWVQNYYGEMFVGCQRNGPIIARIWIDREMKEKMGY